MSLATFKIGKQEFVVVPRRRYEQLTRAEEDQKDAVIAIDSLPPDLAAALENIAVVVEDEHPDDPDLFGLYEGTPLPDRGDMAGSLPDRITIFRLPLEDEFDDPESLEREIRITVLHELGHYFGLDEDRLAELGYE